MRAAEMKEHPGFPQTDVQSFCRMRMPRWLSSDLRRAGMSLDAQAIRAFLLRFSAPIPLVQLVHVFLHRGVRIVGTAIQHSLGDMKMFAVVQFSIFGGCNGAVEV